MSMVNQGFPLWAVDQDGAAYAVVGWRADAFPVIVPLDRRGIGGAGQPPDASGFIFTTTDPTERPERWTIAAPNDLRQRLAALADGLVTSFPHSLAAGHAASRIRQELAK